MYSSQNAKQSGLNGNKAANSGLKSRNVLPPILNSKTSQLGSQMQLGSQQNASITNIPNDQTVLVRNMKEEGQLEMAAMEHDSNSQEENQATRNQVGSYISANSNENQRIKQKEDTFSRVHRTLSKCFCSSAVFWLYIIFIVIFGIINISVCLSAGDELTKLQDSEAYLFGQETLTLWHNRFIMDIQITKSDSCPQNYEEALDYQWPGTLQGCSCPYTVDNRQQIFLVKGKCNSELLSFNCYDIDPTASQYIRNWKNGKRICVQRDTVYSFFNAPTSCNSNSKDFRSCGTGQTAVCRQLNQDCPVSYIQSQNNDNVVGNVQNQVKLQLYSPQSLLSFLSFASQIQSESVLQYTYKALTFVVADVDVQLSQFDSNYLAINQLIQISLKLLLSNSFRC